MNRYEFLTALHQVVNPRRYLEIGVQTGASLQCALAGNRLDAMVGVDPEMGNLQYHPAGAILVESTSDDFFDSEPSFIGPDGKSWLDLVFIDGLHHSEQVWRDLANAASHGHDQTIYVLDDVLPRNDGEAHRIQCPGDWAGDVWKVLLFADDRLRMGMAWLVDSFPTGIAVFAGSFDWSQMHEDLGVLHNYFTSDHPVLPFILDREDALPGEAVIGEVRQWLAT